MQGSQVLTTFPLAWRYSELNLVSSAIVSSSSSDPSILSKVLALAMGDFGEVGLIDFLVELFPDTNDYLGKKHINIRYQPFNVDDVHR